MSVKNHLTEAGEEDLILEAGEDLNLIARAVGELFFNEVLISTKETRKKHKNDKLTDFSSYLRSVWPLFLLRVLSFFLCKRI